mmetsp:Transcript_22902/g.42432  ORF Transcript_22902/g.42432 Transcript_22902/m.42432 type:complete len:108 (-) Transcript_22902:1-324(-)
MMACWTLSIMVAMALHPLVELLTVLAAHLLLPVAVQVADLLLPYRRCPRGDRSLKPGLQVDKQDSRLSKVLAAGLVSRLVHRESPPSLDCLVSIIFQHAHPNGKVAV